MASGASGKRKKSHKEAYRDMSTILETLAQKNPEATATLALEFMGKTGAETWEELLKGTRGGKIVAEKLVQRVIAEGVAVFDISPSDYAVGLGFNKTTIYSILQSLEQRGIIHIRQRSAHGYPGSSPWIISVNPAVIDLYRKQGTEKRPEQGFTPPPKGETARFPRKAPVLNVPALEVTLNLKLFAPVTDADISGLWAHIQDIRKHGFYIKEVALSTSLETPKNKEEN